MAPKSSVKVNLYSVVSIQLESDSKVLTVPCNWVKENLVTYSIFPLNQDDEDMINSFLHSAGKITTPAPSSWPKYECIVLESFVTLAPALKKMKKLQEDPKAVEAIINKVLISKENVPSKKAKIEESLMKSIEDTIGNLPPPPAIILSPESLVKVVPEKLPDTPAIIISPESLEQVPVDIIDDVDVQDDKTILAALNSKSDDQMKNTSKDKIDDQDQPQYLLVKTSDVQNALNQIEIISGQLFSLNSKQDQLMQKFEFFGDKLDSLKEEVKNLGSKSRREKFAAVDVSTKLQELHTAVIERRALKENENVVTLHKLQSKYELVLPILNLQDFQTFDAKLEQDLETDLRLHFLSTVSSDINQLKRSMFNTFKAFFSKSFLFTVVAQKSKPDKLTFSSTRFYRIWRDAVHNIFGATFDEKLFLTTIGNIIKNSGDWEGGRDNRDNSNKKIKVL